MDYASVLASHVFKKKKKKKTSFFPDPDHHLLLLFVPTPNPPTLYQPWKCSNLLKIPGLFKIYIPSQPNTIIQNEILNLEGRGFFVLFLNSRKGKRKSLPSSPPPTPNRACQIHLRLCRSTLAFPFFPLPCPLFHSHQIRFFPLPFFLTAFSRFFNFLKH